MSGMGAGEVEGPTDLTGTSVQCKADDLTVQFFATTGLTLTCAECRKNIPLPAKPTVHDLSEAQAWHLKGQWW